METHAVLRRRAAASHQSLQEYLLRRLIEEASRPTVDEVLARLVAVRVDRCRSAKRPRCFRTIVIVVDASVLAPALADDGRDGDEARTRLRGQALVAPELIDLRGGVGISATVARWAASSPAGRSRPGRSHRPAAEPRATPAVAAALLGAQGERHRLRRRLRCVGRGFRPCVGNRRCASLPSHRAPLPGGAPRRGPVSSTKRVPSGDTSVLAGIATGSVGSGQASASASRAASAV